MSTQFTNFSENSIWTLTSDSYDMKEAVAYLNNPDNFRTFSQGITELMCRYSYTGSKESIKEKTDFIYNRLVSIGVSVTKITISDWFADKRRPALVSNSRTLMYQICFALSVSLEDMLWFFSHVYFDRSFNCHTINEAVYYYCFSNHYDYSHALRLIQKIEDMPLPGHRKDSEMIPTREICERLNRCSSDEELLSFFRENKELFSQWNITAGLRIREYLSKIQGKETDKEVTGQIRRIKEMRDKNNIENIEKIKKIPSKDLDNCGLVVREFLQFRGDAFLDDISGKNIASIDFMLDCIFSTEKRVHKNVRLPEIVRTNFPNKKVFSNLLKNISSSTSYDSIRKCLIFLKFYHFWCNVLLNPELLKGVEACIHEIYLDETNALLFECGYEEMFHGNPYDWLFLYAATLDAPLDGFREAVCEIFETE